MSGPTADLHDTWERAQAAHRAGRLDEAAGLYHAVLAALPDHFDTLQMLAVLEFQRGRLEDGLRWIDAALRVRPDAVSALHNRGQALLRLNRFSDALAVFDRLCGLGPGDAEIHAHRGNLLMILNRPAEALTAYDRALALRPDQAQVWNCRGNALRCLRRPEEALASIDRALALHPAYVEAYNNRAVLLRDLNRPHEALASYERALAQQPDAPEILNNRGNTLLDLDRPEEALASFDRALALQPGFAAAHNNRGGVLKAQGRLDEALASYERALALDPANAEAHNNRGVALRELNRHAEALASFDRALALQPGHVEALVSRGTLLIDQRRYPEALACYDRALALDPAHASALNNRGNLLRELYRAEESLACYERAIALKPDFIEGYSNKFFALLSLARVAPPALYQEHRRFAERFEAPLQAGWPRHGNLPDPGRRLKVGYVSADFRNHSVAYFLEPIWAHHDKGEVEVYAYYNALQGDAVTARLRGYTDHWRVCKGDTDARLAERIRADGIDLLVDLSGHTGKHRLLTFARKPAPVQVSYLGYAATTGLTAMDWRLTHADVDPAGYEAYYTERLYRLPGSLWCYRPSPELGEVAAEPPLIKQGHVTFGSMNNLAKVSPETIAVWAEILRALPDARLAMTSVPAGAEAAVREQFARRGVDAARLSLHDKLPWPVYREVLQQIDIALDPFPYNGTTTTCDTLWQGIPVITRIGNSAVSRSGYALLKSIGLEELAGPEDADYVRLAVALAGDPARLQGLRRGLRARVAASPLRDEAGFTRSLETAYRDMWRAWCRARTG